MCCHNYRTPSLLVGWLCIALGVWALIFYTQELVKHNRSVERIGRSEERSRENDYIIKYLNELILLAKQCIALAVILLLVPSILLVLGISQNRPKLVAAWIYVTYLSVILNILFVIYECWINTEIYGNIAAGLYKSLPISCGLVFTLLCLYPVRKFHKIMSIPPPVLPTHCYMAAKKPEDQRRYIPVFDN